MMVKTLAEKQHCSLALSLPLSPADRSAAVRMTDLVRLGRVHTFFCVQQKEGRGTYLNCRTAVSKFSLSLSFSLILSPYVIGDETAAGKKRERGAHKKVATECMSVCLPCVVWLVG